MGSHASKEDDERHQNKELEKGKDHPDNKKLEANKEFKGPSDPSKRKTTDCLCVILIAAMWFSLTIIGFIVCGVIESADLPPGDPAKLTHMLDYDGGICAVTSGVEDKPYAYFLPSGQVICVDECPSATSYSTFVCQYDLQDAVDADSTGVLGLYYCATYQCLWHIPTVPGPMYACVLDVANEDNALFVDAATSAASSGAAGYGIDDGAVKGYGEVEAQDPWEAFQADLEATKIYLFLFGFVVACMVGFLCLRVIRLPFFMPVLIWGCITAVFVSLLALGCMLKFYTAEQWLTENEDAGTDVNSDTNIMMVQGMGNFFLGLTALWACIICCVRKKIALAIGITKEAARALAAMSSLILFPVIQTAALLVFSVVWMVYLFYLASSGEIVVDEYTYYGTTMTTQSYVYSENQQKAYWYLLFCWFWTSEFIMAVGQLVTAMSVAFWYFARDKSTINSATVLLAIKTTGRYHTGTAAFGSLIIAIIKTLRAVLAKVQKDADKLAAAGGPAAQKLAKLVLCCLQCCMWCIEKCAKFLNKHAYIQTAIFSTSFCTSARKAFFLILRNILLIGAVAIVSEFVSILLLLAIPMGTTFLAYQFFAQMPELSSVFGPTLFTFFISYFTAKKFVETFNMVIATILQCYVADTELFAPEDRFAEGSLKAAVSNGNAAAQKQRKDAGKVAPEPAKAEEAPP